MELSMDTENKPVDTPEIKECVAVEKPVEGWLMELDSPGTSVQDYLDGFWCSRSLHSLTVQFMYY
jgi:hypothetical protein